jgi:hypothetical protein
MLKRETRKWGRKRDLITAVASRCIIYRYFPSTTAGSSFFVDLDWQVVRVREKSKAPVRTLVHPDRLHIDSLGPQASSSVFNTLNRKGDMT